VRLNPNPFFLYLSFNAPHKPLTLHDLPPADQHGFGAIGAEVFANTIFRAQLECVDRQIGEFLRDLPARTVVFVIGDNGSARDVLVPFPGETRYPLGHPLHHPGDEAAQLSVEPYRPARAKGSVYETGVRIPLIVAGPGVAPGVRRDLVDAVDVFRTVAVLRGSSVPAGAAGDSQGFVEILAGGPGTRMFSFCERFAPNGAAVAHTIEDRAYVRQDGEHLWKLIRKLGAADEFYDVAADPLETTDLGPAHREYQATADELEALLAG